MRPDVSGRRTRQSRCSCIVCRLVRLVILSYPPSSNTSERYAGVNDAQFRTRGGIWCAEAALGRFDQGTRPVSESVPSNG